MFGYASLKRLSLQCFDISTWRGKDTALSNVATKNVSSYAFKIFVVAAFFEWFAVTVIKDLRWKMIWEIWQDWNNLKCVRTQRQRGQSQSNRFIQFVNSENGETILDYVTALFIRGLN